ncbi:hypothetical protein GCM10023084_05510 [Streptomyces lacrimifluminis]|uniref:Scaffolding protein n=1 Tax=Streptomyces lacrimifluminis TaxID=1500077 RepID=A0A917KRD5_9ACTN|nr:hypothetical protein [Streptomyces lacrimifluminis]GGJ22916.1 hypothetical protein GCM10012282_19250 [Streptomyces lacrimifluminis]
MNRRTLPRHARAHAPGWVHPYPAGPFSPVFYGDGDDDQDDDGDQDADDSDQDGDADGGQDADDDGDEDEGADDLGDKGKRALASMKGKWKSERDKRKELEDQLAQQGSADEAETVRRKAEQDALAKANARILRAEVKAAAAGKLADPADAFKFLDLDQFEVDDDGNVDSDEVADAIDELIKSKPYLAAATAKRFQGTGDGGAARKASRPKQLSKQDLKTMTPEAIDQARIDGRLDDLMGGK